MILADDNKYNGWDIYPGHIVSQINNHTGEEFIKIGTEWIDIHEGGLIVYEMPNERRVAIGDAKDSIPYVAERIEKGYGWSPTGIPIDWLPIYHHYMPENVIFANIKSYPCQQDGLKFLIDDEDPGRFLVPILQHIRDYRNERNLKYFEEKVGEELREDMRAERVRVWFRSLRRRPSKEGWRGLEDTLVRWLKYSQETPPPVGGAKAIHEMKIVDMGEKKKGMYCEIDLTDTRQETVEAMLAMVATYSETVFPLDYIFFA